MPEPSPSPRGTDPLVVRGDPLSAEELAREEQVDETPVDVETEAFSAVEAGVAPGSRRKGLGFGGTVALAWVVLVVAAALLAPVLPLDNPDRTVAKPREAPSAEHWLGTDGNGRDVFSRVVWGSRTSLVVSVGAVMFGLLIGGLLGLVAGYYRGKLESLLVGAFDVLLAIPQLVFVLALVAVLASGDNVSSSKRLGILVIAAGIVSIPVLARITRANTLAWSQREFVLAARALGAKNRRILFREVMPNVLPAMFSIALLGVAIVIVIEGGLSLLGAGVQLPTPSWGNIIAEGRAALNTAPWIVFSASGAIFLTVLALNYLGDVIRERFDVRESAL
jgi:peptide/nickel transport system permease protein